MGWRELTLLLVAVSCQSACDPRGGGAAAASTGTPSSAPPKPPREAGIERAPVVAPGAPPPASHSVAARPPADHSGPLAQRCSAGYVPVGPPARDVLQLGLLCGPAAGLKALPVAQHDGAGVFRESWDAGAGACYRVVVAGGGGEPSFSVRLTASSAALGVGDPKYVRAPQGSVAVAPGKAELCLSAPGQVTLEVESRRAQRVAYQVWRR